MFLTNKQTIFIVCLFIFITIYCFFLIFMLFSYNNYKLVLFIKGGLQMQKRKVLDNLILNDEDFIFNGNVCIKGEVNITNGSIIVSGMLELCSGGKIVGGNITADNLAIEGNNLYIYDGDIKIRNLVSDTNIISDGNIEVLSDCHVSDVSCLNFLVSHNNFSNSITAVQDIYILGNNTSYEMSARDIFIGGNSYFYHSSVTAKSFYCAGNIQNISSMLIG